MPKAPSGCYWRNGILWACFKVRGRKIRWSLHTSDPKIAKARREAGKERAVAHAYHGEQRIAFGEAVLNWSEWVAKQVGARTAKRYAVSLRALQPFLDNRHLDEIDGNLIAQIITKRQKDGVSNATIKRDLVALSSVLNFCIDHGWIEVNPVLPRMRRLKERRDPIVLPDHADIAKVIARAPGLFGKLIETAARTGCRQQELVGAYTSQVDHGRKQLTVGGKGNKIRVIDLEPFGGYETIKGLPAATPATPLFWHDKGQPYANVASRFRAIVKDVAEKAKEAGESFRPFRFHDLRHRHAVDWLKSGRSLYDLQQRLGHSSIKTTEVYLAYLTPDEVRVVKDGAATTVN